MSANTPQADPFFDAPGLLDGISNNDIDILSELIGYVEPSTTGVAAAAAAPPPPPDKTSPLINQATRRENEKTQHKHIRKDRIDSYCLVCGETDTWKMRQAAGNTVCQACFQFHHDISNTKNRVPQVCKSGNNNCILTPETRKSCRYCRLQKLYSIGFSRITPEPKTIYRAFKSTSKRTDIQAGTSGASKSSISTQNQRKDASTHKSRSGQVRLCEVCGDTGIHRNYGVMVCGACKMFRLKNRGTRPCAECITGTGNCEITPSSRACTSCRFKKILTLEAKVKQNSEQTKLASQESKEGPQNESPDSSQWDSCEDISTSCDEESPIKAQSRSPYPKKTKNLNEMSIESRCKICGEDGYSKCSACTTFIYYYKNTAKAENWPVGCSRGNRKCHITPENRGDCRYCRLKKAISVGFLDAADVPDPRARACHICGDTKVHCTGRGIFRCWSCYKFVKKMRKSTTKIYPTKCIAGDNKCEITMETKNRCQFCRTEKAVLLGAIKRPSVDQSSTNDIEYSIDQLRARAKGSKSTLIKKAYNDGKVCDICGDRADYRNRDINVCQPCKSFVGDFCYADDWPTRCQKGNGKCEITLKTRLVCPSCRLKKMVSLGAFDGILGTPMIESGYEPTRNQSEGQITNPTRVHSKKKACRICGWSVCVQRWGVYLCISCISFTNRLKSPAKRWPTECISGNNKCDLIVRNRASCSYCRMQKAISLGLVTRRYVVPSSIQNIRAISGLTNSVNTSTARMKESCQICGDMLGCVRTRGVWKCWACKQFLHKKLKSPEKWPVSCIRGDNNCEITVRARGECPYCRLQKAILVGAIDRQVDQPSRQHLDATTRSEANRSLSSERTTETRAKKQCQVCGDKNEVYLQQNGCQACRTCRVYLYTRRKGLKKWPAHCITGLKKCEINIQTRAHCGYCRALKMVSLGMLSDPPKHLNNTVGGAEPNIKTSQPGMAQHRQNVSKRICQICESNKRTMGFYHTTLCYNCYNFVNYKHKSVSKCNANCRIYFEHRPLCTYCRSKKAISLGLGPYISHNLVDISTSEAHDTTPEIKSDKSLVDNQHKQQDAGIEVIIIDSSTAPSSVSGDIDVNDDTAAPIEGDNIIDNQKNKDKENLKINDDVDDDQVSMDWDDYNSDDEEDSISLQSTTCYDDIQYYGFSRCFYGDYYLGIRPGDVTRKRTSDERPLTQRREPFTTPSRRSAPVLTMPYTTGLDSHLNLRLYTQEEKKDGGSQASNQQHQSDTDEMELVRSIKTYSYLVSCGYEGEPAAAGEISKPNLTVVLRSENALIDNRRMMTKKIKTDEELLASRHPESVIEPGEDCDDSTDSEIIEIDCDST